MTATKFITLSTDPCSYGSDFDPKDVDPLNQMIRSAAEANGITVYCGSAYDMRRHSEEPEADVEEINWFDTWCGEGYTWNEAQWATWFSAQ